MSRGWISIHRKIQNSDLWNEKRVFSRLEAWLDILLCVNHEPKEVIINNYKVICDSGQSVMSLYSWSKRWGWTISKVRNFFNYLVVNDMVSIDSHERKFQVLSVLHYRKYQKIGETNDTTNDTTNGTVKGTTKPSVNGGFDYSTTQEKAQRTTQRTTHNNKKNKINNTSFFISLTKNQIFKVFKAEGIEKELIEVFLENRLTKKKPIHQKDIDDILSEIKKTELTPNEVFEIIARRNWAHFKSDWLKTKKDDKSNRNRTGKKADKNNGFSRSERIESESEERTKRIVAELQGINAEKGAV